MPGDSAARLSALDGTANAVDRKGSRVRVRTVIVGAGLAVVATFLVACTHSRPAPRAAELGAMSAPAGQPAGGDPCGLIHPDQATTLKLYAPHRSDAAGYTACAWSTQTGSAVSVGLEERVHTVDQFVTMIRAQEPSEAKLTLSPWTGPHHRGSMLDWGDGNTIGVIITLSPTRIVTVMVYSSDPDMELGRSVAEVLRQTAAVVDGNLPA